MKLYIKIYTLNMLPVICCSLLLCLLFPWQAIVPAGLLVMLMYTYAIMQRRNDHPDRVEFRKIRKRDSFSYRTEKNPEEVLECIQGKMKDCSHLEIITVDKEIGKIVARTSLSLMGGAGEKIVIFIHPQDQQSTLIKVASYSIGYIATYKNRKNIKELKSCLS